MPVNFDTNDTKTFVKPFKKQFCPLPIQTETIKRTTNQDGECVIEKKIEVKTFRDVDNNGDIMTIIDTYIDIIPCPTFTQEQTAPKLNPLLTIPDSSANTATQSK